MEKSSILQVYDKAKLDSNGNITYDNSAWIGDPVPEFHVDYFYPYHWFPTYYPNLVYENSKIEQSFKIVSILQKKKYINLRKVKEFIDLVDEISKIL